MTPLGDIYRKRATPRERDVLDTLAATGWCVTDAANVLGLDRGTVYSHLRRVRDRVEKEELRAKWLRVLWRRA